MIKNYQRLLEKCPENEARILLDVLNELFDAVDPRNLLGDVLDGYDFRRYKRIFLIGFGKASVKMAQAVEEKVNITDGHVIYPEGEDPSVFQNVTVTAAAHPLPNQSSVIGALKILEICEKAGEGDLVLSLTSGGGSALMCLPVDGLTLEEKISLNRALIKSGADINEINTVRKHISQIKGGFLAQSVYPADCLNLVFSDVIGDDLSSIASGPLAPDPTTFRDAEEILRKYGISIPLCIKLARKETLKPGDSAFQKIRNVIVANNKTLAQKAVEICVKKHIQAVVVDDNLKGEARLEGKKFLEKVVLSGKIYIASGETTVTVKGSGFGGRNQEFCLAAFEDMQEDIQKRNIVLLSVGSDGVDGICPLKVAGAIVSPSLLETDLSLAGYLDNNDAYSFFEQVSTHVITGQTGVNLGDISLAIKVG